MDLRHVTPALGTVVLLFLPGLALAQYPGAMGGQETGRDQPLSVPPREPIITIVELRGPLPTVEFRDMFKLTDAQAQQYGAVYDSFTVATKTNRDEANHRMEQLNLAVTKRDSAAVDYYAEHLKDLGKNLKTQQSRFDDRVKKLLTKDQQKEYKEYRKKQEEGARVGPKNPRAT
jgi:hypothetical protein